MDIFDDLPDDSEVTIDENKDYLTELVGEGKKFKSPAELAKGKYHSDMTIEVLKKKLDDLNKELNTRVSLEQFLDKQKNPDTVTPPVVPPVDNQGVLDDSTLEERLLKILEAREAQKTTESNSQKVSRVLQEQFGDQAQVLINNKAKELGMSTQALKELASKTPTAFFRLVGVDESAQRTPAGVVAPRQATNSFGNQGTVVKNQAYYEKMKRDDPKQYFKPSTTSEMMRSMAECQAKGIPWN